MSLRLQQVCAALIVATLIPGCGKNKFEQEVDKENSAVKLAREVTRGDYELITTDELKALLDKKADVVLIDAMPYEESFKKQHIASAKQFLFPIPKMEKWDTKKTAGKTEADYVEVLGEKKDKPIIVYCGFVKCTRSHNAAVWAKKNGYTDVKRYAGGIFAWKGAGFPTASVQP